MKKLLYSALIIAANFLAYGKLIAQEVEKRKVSVTLIDSDRSFEKDLEVKKGEVLTIKSGVKLKFNRHVGIICEGKIEAKGTAAEPIIFIAEKQEEGWANVFLKGRSTNGSVFQHCHFSHGKGRFYKFDKSLQFERLEEASAVRAKGCSHLPMTGEGEV